MKLGSKGHYGLKALIDLAEHYEPDSIVQAKDIATRQGIPKDYLALILIDLRKAGFIESVRGPGGGYRLTRHPMEISIGDVLTALEGPVELLDCTAEQGFTTCERSLGCRVRALLIDANQALMEILNSRTLQSLCRPSRKGCSEACQPQAPDLGIPDGITFEI